MRTILALSLALAGLLLVTVSVTAPAGAVNVLWIPGVALLGCAAGLAPERN